MLNRRRFLTAIAATGVAQVGWLGALPHVLGPREGTLTGDTRDPVVRGLLEAQLFRWETDALGGHLEMRNTNPEWDFMGRTFLALALLNAALDSPHEIDRFLHATDRIITHTLQKLDEHGTMHFLLGYARRRPFLNPGGRSLFVDGEVLAMIAARNFVADRTRRARRFEPAQRTFAGHVRTLVDPTPLGHAESYPDECWGFCNAFAMVGLILDGRTSTRDHTRAIARYRSSLDGLIDEVTGMMVSEYTVGGTWQDGPEGSSLFLIISHLALIDPTLAADQYARAKQHLLRDLDGFGWAREWPTTWENAVDIDSGPIIPVLNASPGASGLAFVAAGAMGDAETLSALLTSLELAAFPTWEDDRLVYQASNAVGDAVLLYALVQGPLWEATHA